MICKQCRYHQQAKTDSEQDDVCLHKQGTREAGIRTEYTKHYTCGVMLESWCENHKLFEPRLEVA